MNFFADEGVDGQIVARLREDGHDVLYAAEDFSGVGDEEILRLSNENERILITRDKDFGELAYRDKSIHSGIILSRLYELPSEKKAVIVSNVIQQFKEQLIGSFTVIQPGRVRIKKMQIPPSEITKKTDRRLPTANPYLLIPNP